MAVGKKHHYVPRFYLDRFTDSDGVFLIYDRLSRRMRRAKPLSTAVRKHYYSTEDIHGNKDSDLEEFFSKIESRAKPVFDKLEEGVSISDDDRYNLSLFMGYQYVRTPRYERTINDTIGGIGRMIVEKNLTDLEPEEAECFAQENFGASRSEALEKISDPGYFDSIAANCNMRIEQVVKQGPELGGEFFTARWEVVRVDHGCALVTSDSPFGILTPRMKADKKLLWGFGVASPETVTAYPLSSEVCLLMHGRVGSRHLSVKFKRNRINKGRTHQVNISVARQAKNFAICANEGILRDAVEATGIEHDGRLRRMIFDQHQHPSGDPNRTLVVSYEDSDL